MPQVLTLSRADVEHLLDATQAMDALARGFIALSAGLVQAPPRPRVDVPGKGFSLAMLAWAPGELIALKTVNVFHDNHAHGLPSHMAVIGLFDAETGAAVATMDGAVITGVRTAAASMLTIRALARKDAKVATVIGGGVQAREHLRLLDRMGTLETINVISRTPDSARRVAEGIGRTRVATDIAAAVTSSDIVCLTTSSDVPVIKAAWVKPGTHVTSVGFAPPGGELPCELAQGATVYVETRAAFAALPVGCAELQGLDPAAGIEIGELLSSARPGRTSAQQITVYKSMGNAMEDMVVANLVYRKAKEQGVGGLIEL